MKTSPQDPRIRCLQRNILTSKGKRAAPKDVALRKSIPRSVDIKTKNPPQNIPVNTLPDKAANRKLIPGRSPN